MFSRIVGAIFLLTAARVALAQPAFTYFHGPELCTPKYTYDVPAFCGLPDELPLGSFPVPDVGGSYIDRNFGAKVRLLSDPATDTVHNYSNPSAFSATGKYVLLATTQGWLRVGEASTGAIVVNLSSDFDIASARWSAIDDEMLYTIGGNSKPSDITSYRVSARVRTAVFNSKFHRIETGGTGDLTPDNWMAFWAPAEHQVCAIDLNRVKTYCADYAALQPASRVGWTFIDYVLITKGIDAESGKRYVLLMAEPAMGVFSVNEAAGVLEFEGRGPETPAGMMGGDSGTGNKDGICDPGENCIATPHADVFADRGKQYPLLTGGFDLPTCEADLVSLEISKGKRMLEPMETGGGLHRIMK